VYADRASLSRSYWACLDQQRLLVGLRNGLLRVLQLEDELDHIGAVELLAEATNWEELGRVVPAAVTGRAE